MEKIAVSVYCTVYNHEKYLRECLNGFVMQKTNFRYEVIVHDDASTDGSAEIIREYAENYPDLFVPIYQTENQSSKHISIVTTFILPKVRGKYVASCEGDDYWNDENKLQQQYDALENHPECHFCTHIVQHIFENGDKMDEENPSVPVSGNLLSTEEFMTLYNKTGYPFQTSSFFYKAEDFFEFRLNTPEFAQAADVGDEPIMLYMATKGNTYFIDQRMSCYRKNSVGSWSSRQKNDIEKKVKHWNSMMKMWQLFDTYSKEEYSQIIHERIEGCYFAKCEALVKEKSYARTLLSKRFRTRMKKKSRKYRVYVFLNAYFPFALKVLGEK